jgi:glycosyltransferase involved in cell wall biosynthesis
VTLAGRPLVVVPAYNEQSNVGDVVQEVRAEGYDVLVVDDGSEDGTAAAAAACGATVVRLPLNLGVGGALRCGFRFAVSHGYDVVVQCDGDGQHPAQQVAVLLDAMREHEADMVVGSRFRSDEGYALGGSRRLAMRLLSLIGSRAAGRPMTDTTSGFRAIRQPLLGAYARTYPSQYLGDTFEALVGAGRAGYRVVEVGVRMRPRASGESSAGTGAALQYVVRAVLTVLLGGGKRVKPIGPPPAG